MSMNKTWEIQIRLMDCPMSVFWLWPYTKYPGYDISQTVVLQDVTIGGNWVKQTWYLSVFFSQLYVNLDLSQNKN